MTAHFTNWLSMKVIVLINIKMPIIVDTLTFLSMKETTPESLKAKKKDFLYQLFSLCEQMKFPAQLSSS